MGEEHLEISGDRKPSTVGSEDPGSQVSTRRYKLHGALIVVQVAFSGFEVLSRVALDRGAGKFSFSFYRNCVAFLVLTISAIFFERKRIPFTLSVAFRIFMLGFVGVTMNQVLYLTGLGYTSAVFASTIRNCIPVFTFLMALVFRKEKLNIRTRHGQAKVVGCALGVCGSLLLSVYKGPVLIQSSLALIHVDHPQHKMPMDLKPKRTVVLKFIHLKMASWTVGAVCLVFSCLSFSAFLILQVPVLEKYSAPISFASLCCFSSLFQFPVLAALFEPHWSKWTRIPSNEAISITYAGVVASGFVSAVQSWGVHRGGPVIVAAYQPLETVITAFLGLVFLRENLHLGSVIGAVIVVIGLYCLIWGQEKERQLNVVLESNDFPLQFPSTQFRSTSKSLEAQSRVFPVSDVWEAPQMITVADILDKSKRSAWRVYTVNSELQEIETAKAEDVPWSTAAATDNPEERQDHAGLCVNLGPAVDLCPTGMRPLAGGSA